MNNVAAFGMYDWPEFREETDKLYDLIREEASAFNLPLPDQLTRDQTMMDIWTSPDMLISQTCGLPYTRHLEGKVTLLGSPIYDNGCQPGFYNSVIIVSKDAKDMDLSQMRSKSFCANGTDSQSGYAAMQDHFLQAGLPPLLPKDIKISGSHRNSIKMVANNDADYACIDVVSWLLAQQVEEDANKVKIFDKTREMPSLPFISSIRDEEQVEKLRQALKNAILRFKNFRGKSLFLTGFICQTEKNYEQIKTSYKAIQDALEANG
ncbi:MAG: PhnD/SsuA/transferrin family substrate-binding protein [Alphaproteobacteria bacterium]|nr:PhnD/SsuA/transferrin family substrate-binding protein [Alphaproteobacteria bacterium]